MHMKTPKTSQQKHGERGAAMMISLVFFIVASVLVVVGMTGPTAREFRTASDSIVSRQGYFLAESAAEDVYYRFKNSLTIGATDTLYAAIGNATATGTATIANYGTAQKRIVSTASALGSQRAVEIKHNDGSVDFDITSWAETQ
jgi:Tfp pilus assembly protein PilX